jgi:hypothetical protein
VQQLAFEVEQYITETHEQLRSQGVGDIQVLESEVNKVKRRLPALIMTADGPYHQMIDEMIRELRDRGAALEDQVGSSRLSDREIRRLRMLEEHLRKFVGLDGAVNRDEEILRLLRELREHEQAEAGAPPRDAPPMS